MVRQNVTFRNGSETQEMVPLWKCPGESMASSELVSRVLQKVTFHNGGKSRETVPLWRKGAKGARR